MSPNPPTVIRLLLVEDDPNDVELELAHLRRGGLQVIHRVVDTRAALRAGLEDESWDLVLSDYAMPELTGLDALAIAKELSPLTPFILISGTVGEEIAVEAMRAGANDYVLKMNLTRLPLVVERELREAELRKSAHASFAGLRLLAEVSDALAASLEDEVTLSHVAQLISRSLGPLCVLDLASERGRSCRAVVAHADPARAAQLDELQREHRSEEPAQEPGERAMATRDAIEVDSLADEAPAGGRPSALARIARALGLSSLLSLPLVSNGHVIGALTVARRRPSSAIERGILDELSHRIAVAIENTMLYAQAQRAIVARDQFLTIASHELKTPLTALVLQVDSILKLRESQPELALGEPKVGTKLALVQRQTTRLRELIDTMLAVIALLAGRLELRPERVPLSQVVSAVVQRMEEATARAGCSVRLEARAEPIGEWDPAQLATAVGSLLSNAIKFGAGKPVELIVESEGGRACVRVRDHGVGLSVAQRARIFHRFEGAAPGEHYGGFGLGLWLARTLVEAHGGEVRVESEPGLGSTFTIELPLLDGTCNGAP